jgi:outer membrane receptor protein involved in Fe transport
MYRHPSCFFSFCVVFPEGGKVMFASRFAILTLFALLLSATPAFAQTETGRISGTVTDNQGGVLPGATINLKNVATGTPRSTVTDNNGAYLFANLPPATYDVVVELQGFRSWTTRVVVTVGGSAAVNAKLEVGGLQETVTVTAGSEMVNTVNSEIATTINEAQIRELPTITRNVYDLVALSGNVTPDDQSGRGTGFAINGMRSASTNILLDGSANNDEFDATVGQEVPLDSVQEFSVITNNFSAQYGRATGGIVNVATKSGTNQFRGTVYEFLRNDALSTNTVDNRANNIEKGKFTRHQAGFSIGGPVKRDRLHFFSNLEYIRVRSADTEISWVPTPQFLAASSPATQAFFNRYGKLSASPSQTLTRAQVAAIIGTGAGAFNNLPADLPVFARVEKSLPIDAGGGDPQDNYQWVNRVDYSFGNNSQMYVRYALQDQEAQAGTNASSPYDGYDTGYVNKNHNVLGSFTRVFSSTFTTQSKVVFNRLYGDQPLNGAPQPTLYMNPTTPVRLQGYRITFPGYLPWSPGSAIPFGGPQQLWQIYQDQTWVRGKHDIRFGGSFVRILDDRTFGAYANSVEALNTTSNALVSLNNFVQGQIMRFQTAINPNGFPGGTYTTPVSLPSFNSKNKYNEFAFYVNDNWSVTDRLTVNAGVRYEFYGPQEKSEPKFDSNFYYPNVSTSVNTATPAEMIAALKGGRVLQSSDSPVGGLWASDWNNWAPRLGFAWDVKGDGRTSLRGGYGMAYERNFGNVTYNVLFNPPLYLVASIDAPTDVPSLPIYTDPAGPFGGVAGVTKIIPAGSLRHVDQNIETAYSHFFGMAFQHQVGANLVGKVEYSGSLGRKLYDLADVNKRGAELVYLGSGAARTRPNTQYAAFNSRGNRGESEYHGVTFGVDSRMLGDTGLQFSANYTLGNAKDNLSSTFSDSSNNFNLGYLDAFNPMLDWGPAGFDVRHRGSLSAIWALPFARGSSGMVQALAADWQLNAIFTARSGFPFSVWDCTNGLALCMRALDTVGVDRNATDGPATGNPNEYKLLDLSRMAAAAGSYVHPLTGNSDFGPYPSTMTERHAFRGPGFWNVDLALTKRVRVRDRYAVQFRLEAYNVFDHANMYANVGDADVSSSDAIFGRKDGNRRMQIGLKFEY